MMKARNVLLLLIAVMALLGANAFQAPNPVAITTGVSSTLRTHHGQQQHVLMMAVKKDKQQGVSSSGYRQDRLNKLAELEEERIETDKGFVLKAAGAFVGLLVVLLIAAFASGILYQV